MVDTAQDLGRHLPVRRDVEDRHHAGPAGNRDRTLDRGAGDLKLQQQDPRPLDQRRGPFHTSGVEQAVRPRDHDDGVVPGAIHHDDGGSRRGPRVLPDKADVNPGCGQRGHLLGTGRIGTDQAGQRDGATDRRGRGRLVGPLAAAQDLPTAGRHRLTRDREPVNRQHEVAVDAAEDDDPAHQPKIADGVAG